MPEIVRKAAGIVAIIRKLEPGKVFAAQGGRDVNRRAKRTPFTG
jgi:hypothetical protein